MIDLTIDQQIRDLFPLIEVGLLCGEVSNSEFNPELWMRIDDQSLYLRNTYNFETIREIPPIKSCKAAYRLLGKDPNRYRVSAEAMVRRIVKGSSLYRIHTLVDILNLASIKTGVTIGGFDFDKVNAPLRLGIGRDEEEFDAIGRGTLNISRLPVYRDQIGAIGSPTSDCKRTQLRLETQKFLMIITDFYGESFIGTVVEELKEFLSLFASGNNYGVKIVK